MTNKKENKPVNIFFPILMFWENKRSFLILLFFIALPLLLISSYFWYYAYDVTAYYFISFILEFVAYLVMFLFVISYTILQKQSGKGAFSFNKIIKLIPVISKHILLLIIVLVGAIVFSKLLFKVAPIIIFAIFPVVSFLPLYNNKVPVKNVFKKNQEFLSTPEGKEQTGKVFILALAFFVSFGLLILVFKGIFSFLSFSYSFVVYQTIKELLTFVAFLIIYLFINLFYVNETFHLHKTVNLATLDVLAGNKREHKKRGVSNSRRLKEKEINRFEKKEEYNRFDDQNF